MAWNCGLFLVEIPRSKIQIFDFQLITKSSVASSCHGAALSQSDGKTQYVLFGKWWVFTDKLYFFLVGFGRGKADFSDNLLRDPKSERECSEVRMFQSRKDF